MGILEFIRPVENKFKISSPYSLRVDPVKKRLNKKINVKIDGDTVRNPFASPLRFHSGIDYRAPEGTDVKASEGGVIIRAAWSDNLGETIVIDHTPKVKKGWHIYSMYIHLQKESYKVKIKERVEKGQVIALSGATGELCEGAHLHFAIIKSKSKVGWRKTGGTGIASDPSTFMNPDDYIGKEHEVEGTIYDLSDEEHKKVTESLDVKMHLDFINYSWYGDVYLNKKKVGRIDKDNLDLMAGLSLGELDEIMKTTSFPERGSVVI